MVLTNAELDDLAFIEAGITSLVERSLATRVVPGGIDDGWDDHRTDLRDTGPVRLMEIYQDALDRYYKDLDSHA